MKIEVNVKPGSKEESITKDAFGFTIKTKAQAIDGKANDAVINMLADHFDVPKTRIRIIRGQRVRKKIIEI